MALRELTILQCYFFIHLVKVIYLFYGAAGRIGIVAIDQNLFCCTASSSIRTFS